MIGVIGGLVCCLYNFCAKYATKAWNAEPKLIFSIAMPIVGMGIVLTEKLLKTEGNGGSNTVMKEAGGKDCNLPLKFTVSNFITLLLTNLSETVTGREGASWQLTAPIAKLINGKLFPDTQKRIAISAAIGAGFGTLWGLPLFGAFAGSEMAFGSLYFPALGPSLVSAYIGRYLAKLLFPNDTIYKIEAFESLDAIGWLKMVVLAVAIGLFARLFIAILDNINKGFALIKNTYLKIFVGGAIVGILCYFAGKYYMCGVTTYMIDALAGKSIPWYAFAAKILFFGILFKSGYKTGILIQTMVLGAMFGGVIGPVFGLPIGLSAALGLAGLVAATFNIPFAALALAYECFGGNYILHFVLCIVIARVVSGKCQIYAGQDLTQKKPIIVFKKEI